MRFFGSAGNAGTGASTSGRCAVKLRAMAETNNDDNHWRKLRMESDERTGEIIVSYGMPNGVPDIRRYPRAKVLKNADEFVRVLLFHITP